MNQEHLAKLLAEYRAAPEEFQATSYWASYEDDLLKIIRDLDFKDLRSGKHRALRAFGFSDAVFHRKYSSLRAALGRLLGLKPRYFSPYSITRRDVEAMAFRHCDLYGQLTGALPIASIEASAAGGPQNIFLHNGKRYTVSFLTHYLRYCFAQQYVPFADQPVFVELGSGSGYLVEVLKKLYPNLTVLCFDMPGQIFLCEQYLSEVFGRDQIVSSEIALNWKDLSGVEQGKINFLGNWQMPLLQGFKFDLFWNAASFGEMEPKVVENYLSYVKGNARWVYLQQLQGGQKTTGSAHVKEPVTLEMYRSMLSGYELLAEQDGYAAHYLDAGNYFEAMWQAN